MNQCLPQWVSRIYELDQSRPQWVSRVGNHPSSLRVVQVYLTHLMIYTSLALSGCHVPDDLHQSRSQWVSRVGNHPPSLRVVQVYLTDLMILTLTEVTRCVQQLGPRCYKVLHGTTLCCEIWSRINGD
ncbi:hypothetical protein RRG08_001355 [Elysia crispata]|uniref:Uncharacterized protein n=1 Tax=Elysia crispata TaxID=231223 RepID=A0AAE1B7N1_9GAST|nr:hypothetical protein RRG08_001355 [Elysia crispata]